MPLSVPMWLDLASSAQAGLDALWAACGADADCRSVFPKARAEFNELLSRLAKSSVLVKWEDPQTGKPLEKTVTERDARDLVYALLYSVPLAVQIPMVVHRALGGDFDAFAEPPPGPGEIPRGVLLSLLCSEELERVDRARIAEASARSFLGDWPLRMQMAWCDAWPKGPVPGSFRSAVASDVPALLMTGAFDSTTPPRYAETVARTLNQLSQAVRLAALPRMAYEILEPSGRVMASGQTGEPARELPAGDYLVRVEAPGQPIERKVTVVPDRITMLSFAFEGDKLAMQAK